MNGVILAACVIGVLGLLIALLLGFQYLQGFVGVAGGDDAVGHLIFQIPGSGGVAHIGEGRPVPVGAQPVRTPGPDVG